MKQKPLVCLLSSAVTTISFFLWRAIDFSMTLLENVRPLTAATFGDCLSSRTQTHSHRLQAITIGLKDGDCLTTAMAESKLQY